MARKYSETTDMANLPDLNPDGGFPSKSALTTKNKKNPDADLVQIEDGGGTQSGAHPAKTQGRVMRYF